MSPALPLAALAAAAALLGTAAADCSVPAATRAEWAASASASLEASDDYTVTQGALRYSAMHAVSNPRGGYASVVVDGGLDPELCECLKGNTSVYEGCTMLRGYLYSGGSESDVCDHSMVLDTQDALVHVGCLPPNSTQYWSWQQNVLSRFQQRGHSGYVTAPLLLLLLLLVVALRCPAAPPRNYRTTTTTTYHYHYHYLPLPLTDSPRHSRYVALDFPEVSPLDTINHLTVQTDAGAGRQDVAPWDRACVVVSTADAQTYTDVAQALTDAGVPEAAITFDNLNSQELRLGSSGPDWRNDLPDVLQLVVRMSGENTPAVQQFVADTDEQLVLLVRAAGNRANSPAEAAVWRERVTTDSEAQAYEARAATLDAIVELTTTSMLAQYPGFALSYAGEGGVQMDYGYDHGPPSDVAVDVLDYPPQGGSWASFAHYSTRDCLYHGYGVNPFAMDNSLFGPTFYSSADSIDAAPYSSGYSTLTCGQSSHGSGTDGGEWTVKAWSGCDDSTCGECATGEDVPKGCLATPSKYISITCVEGDDGEMVPFFTAYADKWCQFVIYNVTQTSCYEDELELTNSSWAGGYVRDDTKLVMVGLKTNALNSSTFHDVSLATTTNYSNPDASLTDFLEEDLAGSVGAYLDPAKSAELEDGYFIATWARECAPGDPFCRVISDELLPSPSQFVLISRQYLHPGTLTGPSNIALPGHRYLVFDKITHAPPPPAGGDDDAAGDGDDDDGSVGGTSQGPLWFGLLVVGAIALSAAGCFMVKALFASSSLSSQRSDQLEYEQMEDAVAVA